MGTVLVSGKFDPFHQGHADHIKKAAKLGEFLIVSVASDEGVINSRVSHKLNIPFLLRKEIIEALLVKWNIGGLVVESLDRDGRSVLTLKKYKPDIYAKGGDRTPSNMLQSEIDFCKDKGIEIKYGIGDLLNSSSSMEVCCGSCDCASSGR